MKTRTTTLQTQSFEVSNLHYGRDNGTMTGAFPGEGTDDFIALAPYDIFEDVTVYAIDVAIVAGSEDGTPVIAHLFDGSDENYITEQYGGLFASTAELDLASQYSNDGTEDDVLWYTLVLEEPAQLGSRVSDWRWFRALWWLKCPNLGVAVCV